MMNRLSSAVSPYLLQHANDPVDWEPWDEQTLTRARAEDRPIFLSIGFATCDWCHVMARESFRDEHIAALLNRHFVCIKVDRDERPDLDEVYLQAVQELMGSAGWPLNVFLTPQLEPFFGGTYFPPRPCPGEVALPDVLEAVAAAWAHKRDTLRSNARRVVDALTAASESPQPPSRPVDDVLEAAWKELLSLHDPVWGGFGVDSRGPRNTSR